MKLPTYKPLWILTLLLVMLAACETEPATTTEEPTADTTAMMEEEPTPMSEAPATKINLNTATGDEFRTIPDVGDRMVHEFEEYRPYISIQQFRQEIGKYVDEAQIAAYEKYLYVPIDRNESDAATLQQISGLNAAAAEELISGRPYASNAAFLEALSDYISSGELATAEQYLTSE
jgi:DNA uptake protein ComE-like DNA-binding protein